MTIKSYNPANNELLGQVKSTSIGEIKEIVNNSKYGLRELCNMKVVTYEK